MSTTERPDLIMVDTSEFVNSPQPSGKSIACRVRDWNSVGQPYAEPMTQEGPGKYVQRWRPASPGEYLGTMIAYQNRIARAQEEAGWPDEE